MSQDGWERLCTSAVTWAIGQFPSVVKNGFSEGGTSWPPLINVALPDVSNYDSGKAMTGFCGVGSKESGDCFFSFTDMKLNGLDSIVQTSGQAVTFTTPDTAMAIPLTIGALTLKGNWSIQQGCDFSSAYTVSAQGTFTATITDAMLIVNASDINLAAGPVGAVSVVWTKNNNDYSGKVTIPQHEIVAISLPPNAPPNAPAPNKFTLELYFLAVAPRLLMTSLVNYVQSTAFGSEIRALFNQGFQQSIQKVLVQGWGSLFSGSYLHSEMTDPLTVTNQPSDPTVDGAQGFPLGVQVPDLLGEITLGTVPVGNAQGFLTTASVAGLSGLTPLLDPGNPTLNGLTFTPAAGGTPTAFTCALTIPSLSLSGTWVIQQPEMLVGGSTGGGCSAQPMMSMALGFEPTAEHMNLLYQLKTDLLSKGGAMGAWYVGQYYACQPELLALMKDPDWNAAVTQYSGNPLWGDILGAIQSATTGGTTVALSTADAQNALALVSEAQQITSTIPTSAGLFNTISAILPYLSDYQAADGESYTYAQLLTIIAGETPPTSGQSASSGMDETRSEVNATRPAMMSGMPTPLPAGLDPMGQWNGTFNTTLTGTSGTAAFDIAWNAPGQSPTLTCTNFSLTVPPLSLSYAGSDFASKCLVWLQTNFDPSASTSINGSIQSTITKTASGQSLRTDLSKELNTLIDQLWQNPPNL